MDIQNQPAEQQQQTQENQFFFYHSNPNFPITRRRYTAGGLVVQQEIEGETKQVMHITYAVCSLKDEFSKKRGRQIVTNRIKKGSKVLEIVLNEEQAAHPSRTLRDFASHHAPLVAFGNRKQKEVLRAAKAELKEGETPLSTDEILVGIPTQAEFNQMVAQRQQAQQGIQTLQEAMQEVAKQEAAQA